MMKGEKLIIGTLTAAWLALAAWIGLKLAENPPHKQKDTSGIGTVFTPHYRKSFHTENEKNFSRRGNHFVFSLPTDKK